MALIVPDLAAARDAATKTRLADIYVQPEMQAFLAPAIAQMKTSYTDLRAKNALLPALADIDSGLFGSEVGVAVYARVGDPNLPAGVIATLAPKDPEAFKRLFPANLRNIMIDGMVIPLGAEPKDAAVTFDNGRAILCVPQSDIGMVLKRQKDPAARKSALAADPGFINVHGRLSASAAYLYVAPRRCIEMLLAAPNLGTFNPVLARSVLGSAGLMNADAAGAGVGFSATDPIFEAYLNFTAPPKDDLLSLFSTQSPISPDALKIAAPEAPYVAGGFVNFSALIPFIRSLAAGAGPEAATELDQLQALSQKVLGFDLQADLLANVGSEIVVAQTVLDTGAPLSFAPGLVATIPLKNAAKVEDCIKKLGAVIDHASEGLDGAQKLARLRLKRLEHHGKPIYYLTGQVLAGPVSLAFFGDRLLVCSSYNAAKRGIEQLEANTSVLTSKDFQETIARLTGKPFDPKALPSSFGYSIDRGSGAGALLLTGAGLAGATAALGGIGELPTVPLDAANAQGINIPANESGAIQACKNFAEAEEIYHRTDYSGNGVLKYAPSLSGDNSLFELKAGAGDLALIDKALADAEGEPGGKSSKQGYRFKVLKGQGEHAAGGARSYVATANMTLGYALVAYPAEFGVTGRRTFIINSSGVVFGKDLGAATADTVKAMSTFDPDPTWAEATDEQQPPARLAPGGGNELEQFLARPSGKTVMAVLNAIDLGLWPDEGFFIKYRRPTGAVTISAPDGIYWRSELPPPGPSSSLGVNPAMMVAGIAMVSAIAIPSLLRSRMAANETAAAASTKAFAEAEEIYHRTDYTGNGVLKYAQTLRDLTETKPGAYDIALLDRAFVNAEATGKNPVPKAGYLFKVLTAQGQSATGGKRDYVVNGNMVLGYALVAFPAVYDSTGRDTFIINNNGTIFQKDRGPDTRAEAEKMTEFDPDNTWIPTQ